MRFDELMHAQGPHLAELRAAGVSERRIEALYPFDFENYRDATVRLFEDGGRSHSQATNLSMFSIYEQIAARLPSPRSHSRSSAALSPACRMHAQRFDHSPRALRQPLHAAADAATAGRLPVSGGG